MTAPPRRVLFRCDGAPVPVRLDRQEWTDRRVITSIGPAADLTLHIASLAGAVLTRIGPRTIDVVRIAAYAYRADQTVSRGGSRDAHDARWKRHLALCVPVLDLAYWTDAGVGERLTAALRFLTDDVWEFAFAGAGADLRQLPLDVQDQELLGQPSVVVPFSGGVDSLCVLLEAAGNGQRPVAVGHWSTPTHRARQEVLLARVREHFPGWNFPLLGLPVHRLGAQPADSTQRTRGFLYAALGTAIAGELGLGRVAFGDNGPVSVNLPINAQLIGALASRSTHPAFLDRFNRLVADLFPVPVVVANPLQGRTRTEALAVLKTTRCEDLLPLTLSCSKWSRLPAATPHCGSCSQCVDRRFATIAAGLESYDPAARYKRDIFLDALVEPDARTTAESYVRFAQRVYRLSDDALTDAFPQVFDAVTPGDSDPEATVLEVIELAKRHARTVIDVLKEMTRRHLDARAEGRLPATCLLQIAGAEPDGEAVKDPPTESTGAPPPRVTGVESNGAQGSVSENVFAYEGEMWTLAYRGVTRHLKPNVGLTRVACLLARPRREFTADGILAETTPLAEPPMSEATAELHGLRPERYASGGTKLDRTAIDDYEWEAKQLLRALDDARDEDDAEEVARLEDLVQQVSGAVTGGLGLGGKLKPFVDDRSRRHDTVYQSIHRIILRLIKVHPHLGEHLDRAVRRGTIFSYAPEEDVRWRVHLPKTED